MLRIYITSCSSKLAHSRSFLQFHRCPLVASTSQFHNGNTKQQYLSSPEDKLLLKRNGLILNGIRLIRSRSHPTEDGSSKSHSSEKSTSSSDDDSGKSEDNNSSFEKGPDGKAPNPELVRKLRMYVLVVAGMSFVMSFFLLGQMFTGDRKLASGIPSEDFTRPGIDFGTFVQKYLNRGEVQKIVFVPTSGRAIAILHPGAIVDGQQIQEKTVVVSYPHNQQQFWAEIRKEEANMGIGLAQGVPIDLYQGMTTFRLIELILGVVIIAWLFTQYGRLMRKRLLENKAKKQGGGSGGPN